jgi:aspartate aminotransferase-like enzyme
MTATAPHALGLDATSDDPFANFFLPGPTAVHPEVLAAMTRPMIAHRGAEFEALFARMQDGLRVVFGTARPVFVSSSSATGLMEAGMRATPPGRVLSVVNGAFSERYARSCGRATASSTCSRSLWARSPRRTTCGRASPPGATWP